ncbi:MAG: hypothetical protein KDD82_06960, partial [Planctomycetes bacterium]|nr:hypothetical protein [Planctomycetota bacterium]
NNALYASSLAAAYDTVGQAEQALGNLPGALENYREARARMQALLEATPSDYALRRHLAVVWGRTGTVYDALAQPERAHEALLASERGMRALAEGAPEQSQIVRDYSVSMYTRAQFLEQQGRIAAATELMQRVVANHTRLVAQAPQFQGELEQLTGVAERFARRLELSSGARAPASPAEQLEVARARYAAGDFLQAAEAYLSALTDAEVRGEVSEAHLYNGACAAARAAAQAGGAERARWTAQALAWLSEDVRLRRAILEQVAEQLADPELHPSQRSRLETIRAQVQGVMDYARTEDTDLAGLRALPEFEAIFAD